MALAWLLGAVLLGVTSTAYAGGGRQVPDLRRDAAEWAQPRAAQRLRIPVTLHVATEAGTHAASRAAMSGWIARANRELAPFGIEVEVVALRAMPAGFSAVTHWRSRRELATHAARDGTVHVFAIEALDDGHRSRRVRGLHWRYRGIERNLRGREYLVVTSSAPPTTLAHEFGHLFGLRHSTRPDNIMCSCRRGPALVFSPAQGASMREGARRLLARQEQGSARTFARNRDRRR